ncbi:MAG: hypothetical protein D6820_08530 [Lentisphaerae bacterium]|nr:MAG: hypothetical protein D6820_08530 [Lentisphaerota bacterium]
MLIEWEQFFELTAQRQPDFTNLEKVLQGGIPSRPTLFEFFLNDPLERFLASHGQPETTEDWPVWKIHTHAFRNAGYDYVTLQLPGFAFPKPEKHREATISLNDAPVITSWETFETYSWPDPDQADMKWLDEAAEHLPPGMKIIVCGPGGVEENVIQLMGYENLCFALVDNPDLVAAVFDKVGSALTGYYARIAPHPKVGACISNDDWGFKTQTLLSIKHMQQYLFPWHKKIVDTVHAAGKPVILHSCGYFLDLIDILHSQLQYDARHSYEDNITPVEEAYDLLQGRIAVLGGIDLDFVCRSTPEEVFQRAKRMLQKTASRGGYALGSGNSIPPYVPWDNYRALISPALLLEED